MTMKREFLVVVLMVGGALDVYAGTPVVEAMSVIPSPAKIEMRTGEFTLRSSTRILAPVDAAPIARYLADLLSRTCRLKLEVASPDGGVAADKAIVLVLDSANRNPEGYTLDIGPRGIVIEASERRGLFYGAVTLWQWLTARPHSADTLRAAAVHIEDQPQAAWRGFMLDVARHYMSVEFIKQMIDWMALHKLNTFHWHLTDDQGWRLQILKYPRLTEIGSVGVSNGYYTQEEVREIVRYAADRFVTVVPEIEMPGHAQAAIAAYPAFGTEGPAPQVSRDWGVHDYLFNADEPTLGFLEDVLTEVISLFPGPYIHVGGDEAAKNRWKTSPRVQQRMRELGIASEAALQGYFAHRMEGFIDAHGRKLIGWDEILEGGLPPKAVVMSWRGREGAAEAARQGHDVVLAPAPDLYLDYLQSDLSDEPPGRPTYVTLADIYRFDASGSHVIGAQLNAWTEHMRTPERVQHSAFPRMAAFSEAVWSAPGRRNWGDFLLSLPAQFDRYRRLGIDYADSAFVVRASAAPASSGPSVQVELSNQVTRGDIRYSLTNDPPGPNSPLYSKPLAVVMPITVSAATFLDGQRMSEPRTWSFTRETLQRRSDDELKSCSNKLPLRLEDDAPQAGERAVFNVDILDPCWIFPQADLSRTRGIAAAVGQIPFNFQVGDDARKVPLHAPQSPQGELEVRIDGCGGERIAVLPLEPAVANAGVSVLQPVSLIPREGRHDLCLYFTRRTLDPIWAIEWVQLKE